MSVHQWDDPRKGYRRPSWVEPTGGGGRGKTDAAGNVKFGSLFSGIGGMDLGLERAGMECRWQVEIDDYCRRVLAKHWPDVPRYGDVKEITQLEYVDLVAGGFPCQPVSLAGARKGQSDERWLWPQFLRIVRMVRPRLVLVENVPGLLTANGGGAMGEVLGGLAGSGYDAEWQSLPAAAFGAPHIRERVFILAHATEYRRFAWRQGNAQKKQGRRQPDRSRVGTNNMADADASNGHRGSGAVQMGWFGSAEEITNACERNRTQWGAEPGMGRVAHGIPDRVDRLGTLGNAVVPQVAEWLGRRILAVTA